MPVRVKETTPMPDQGGQHYSFPSGEVTVVSAIITPFVFENHDDYPAVYLLEWLPLSIELRG